MCIWAWNLEGIGKERVTLLKAFSKVQDSTQFLPQKFENLSTELFDSVAFNCTQE